MQRILWLFVIALLTVDVTMLLERRHLQQSVKDLARSSAGAVEKARYSAEEDALITAPGVAPTTFPRGQTGRADDERVQFFLVASIEDCTNSIEDEVTKLNQVALQRSERIAEIRGFFVDENRAETADSFIKHLSPAPLFPMTVSNVLSQLPGATTPLVLVVRAHDGKILDVHKPIPEELRRRDAFYARWSAVLGLS